MLLNNWDNVLFSVERAIKNDNLLWMTFSCSFSVNHKKGRAIKTGGSRS
jgi:hypothetical protein